MREITPLRIGVLLAGDVLPAWKHRVLWTLACSDEARLALVVELCGAPPPPLPGFALRAYERLDRALFGARPDPLAPTDARELLAGGPRITVRCIRRAGGVESDLDREDLRALELHGLDALLALAGGPLAGAVLGAARLGVWTFSHEEELWRGRLPFHAAMIDGSGAFETRLVADTPAGRTTLHRATATANPNSLDRCRSGALWRAADLPARAWHAFAAGYAPPFDGRPDVADAPIAGAPAPGAFAIGRHTISSAARVARNRARLLRSERVWFIALRRRGRSSVASDPLDGFQALPCPIDRFHADPILIRDGDAHHLFFEDADRSTGLGAISWRSIDAAGRAGPVHRVLDTDTHLSHPFVFRWRGAWFMIPETSARRTVELYRAVEFPMRWELEKILFHDIAAVDSTVFEHRGLLWLFAAMSPSGGSLNDELFLFHADAPTGTWVPHPMNPIVSDVRHARPAGPLFLDGDALYRPGQDCAGDYGAAFWIHRVDALDERHYRETPVRRIAASWHPGGLCTHTYSRAGDFEAIDNRIWRPRLGRASRGASILIAAG